MMTPHWILHTDVAVLPSGRNTEVLRNNVLKELV